MQMYPKSAASAKRLPSPPTPFPRRTSRGAAARHIMEHLAAVAARWFAVFAGAPGTTDAPAPRPASPPNLPRKFTASVPLPAAVPAAVPPLASGASACGPIQQLGGPQSVVALDVSSTVSPLVRSGQPPPLALQENGTATRVRAAVPPAEQKQLLGQRLFPLVQSMEPHLAGKITGMLLEMDNGKLLTLLEEPEALNDKVMEAISVLQMHDQLHAMQQQQQQQQHHAAWHMQQQQQQQQQQPEEGMADGLPEDAELLERARDLMYSHDPFDNGDTCRFFGSERGCRNGPGCTYTHDAPNSVELCRYGVHCLKMAACTFRHRQWSSPLHAWAAMARDGRPLEIAQADEMYRRVHGATARPRSAPGRAPGQAEETEEEEAELALSSRYSAAAVGQLRALGWRPGDALGDPRRAGLTEPLSAGRSERSPLAGLGLGAETRVGAKRGREDEADEPRKRAIFTTVLHGESVCGGGGLLRPAAAAQPAWEHSGGEGGDCVTQSDQSEPD